MTTTEFLKILDSVSATSDNASGLLNNGVLNLAVMLLMIEVMLIFFRKQNDNEYPVSNAISQLLLCGGFIFSFDFLFAGFDLLCQSFCSLTEVATSETSAVQTTLEEQPDENIMLIITNFVTSGSLSSAASGAFVDWVLMTILKPIADFLNLLVYPVFWLERKLCLYFLQMLAPLVIVLGAVEKFRDLWKKWFLLYAAVWCTGPALAAAHLFIDQVYGATVGYSIIWYLMISFARMKIYRTSVDFVYKVFNC